MEFKEVFTSPFTTQTTCYSCGGKPIFGASKSPNSSVLQFATENHILGVRISENVTGSSSDDVRTSCRSLPRDSAQLTCVGYANWEEVEKESEGGHSAIFGDPDNAILSSTTVRHIEAITLIDLELVEDHELSSSTVNIHRPSSVIIEKDDGISVAQSKRTPISTVHSGTTGIINPSLSSGSYHRKSQSELSKGSHTTISDTQHSNNSNTNMETDKSKNEKKLRTQKSKARLVLRQDQYVIHQSSSVLSGERDEEYDEGRDTDDEQEYHRQLRRSSFALLDFRPLCPCLAKWGEGGHANSNIQINHNDEDEDGSFLGIWLGSADDATLRLYAPSPIDSRSLISVSLPEEHFSVDSPVMALDFCSVHCTDNGEGGLHGGNNAVTPTTITMHTLAIACQDGTIQLITWRNPSIADGKADKKGRKYNIFGNITSQKVIVDGPLVCLKLDYNEFASLRVIAGSLCGYVCQLTYDCNNRGKSSDSYWEGPYMVVPDLFNSSINIEESVLTVDVWDNYVAVGTQLGRCLLYATYDSENYFLAWQTVLPYPVHGIIIIKSASTKEGHEMTGVQEEGKCLNMLGLAVTTRRSFHMFVKKRGSVAWRQKPKWERYSSELARTRLSKILEKIRNENHATDSKRRNCVGEIIEGLLEKIEEAAGKTTDDVVNHTSIDQESVANIVSCTISDIIERIEENFVSENKTPTSSFDSYDIGDKSENTTPIDPPQWEYSSSDEE